MEERAICFTYLQNRQCIVSYRIWYFTFLCENLCPNHIHNMSLPDLGTIAYQHIECVVAKFLWQFLRKESHHMK